MNSDSISYVKRILRHISEKLLSDAVEPYSLEEVYTLMGPLKLAIFNRIRNDINQDYINNDLTYENYHRAGFLGTGEASVMEICNVLNEIYEKHNTAVVFLRKIVHRDKFKSDYKRLRFSKLDIKEGYCAYSVSGEEKCQHHDEDGIIGDN